MPLTTGLRPGKFYVVNGTQVLTKGPETPHYDGTINKYATGNMNSNAQFRVFEEKDGIIQSQNKTLINQDNGDYMHVNKDLRFALDNRYHMTRLDWWMQLEPSVQAFVPRPYTAPLRNLVG